MTRAHGDPNRYTNGPDKNGKPGKGCRCGKCRKAAGRSRNLQRAAVIRGESRPRVDAEPVRAHVLALNEAGMSSLAIVRASGVASSTMTRLVGTDRTPQVKTVRATTADALFAVCVGGGTDLLVPGIETQRRLRGLAWLGWPGRIIAEHSDVTYRAVRKIMTADVRVTVGTAARVVATCRRLHGVDPVAKGVDPRRVALAREHAAAAGWVPLAAWDAIADPNAIPNLGERPDRALALLENSDWLAKQGYTREQVAERLGLAPSSLRTARARARKKLAQVAS